MSNKDQVLSKYYAKLINRGIKDPTEVPENLRNDAVRIADNMEPAEGDLWYKNVIEPEGFRDLR